jgi:hypothetical protein
MTDARPAALADAADARDAQGDASAGDGSSANPDAPTGASPGDAAPNPGVAADAATDAAPRDATRPPPDTSPSDAVAIYYPPECGCRLGARQDRLGIYPPERTLTPDSNHRRLGGRARMRAIGGCDGKRPRE